MVRKQIHDTMLYKAPKDMKHDFGNICKMFPYLGSVNAMGARFHEFGTTLLLVKLFGFEGNGYVKGIVRVLSSYKKHRLRTC